MGSIPNHHYTTDNEWEEDERIAWNDYTAARRMRALEEAQQIGVLDAERKERAKRAMAYLSEVANG